MLTEENVIRSRNICNSSAYYYTPRRQH